MATYSLGPYVITTPQSSIEYLRINDEIVSLTPGHVKLNHQHILLKIASDEWLCGHKNLFSKIVIYKHAERFV
jgi:hypothetical protein